VLVGAVIETAEAGRDGRPVVAVGTLRRGDGGAARLLASLAQAHVQGVEVDWTAVLPAGQRVELPTYAFQRQAFWPKPAEAQAAHGHGTDSAADARFWSAVEGGDRRNLAAVLDIDANRPFHEALPALAAWRRRRQAEESTAQWRYRVTWKRLPDPDAGQLNGCWLAVVPAGHSDHHTVRRSLAALAGHGAAVEVVEVDASTVDRPGLAVRLGTVVEGFGPTAVVSGVVSLLALDERQVAQCGGVAAGLIGSQVLVQALGDAGVGAPLWMVTSGAVAADAGESVGSPVQAQVWGLGRVVGLEHPERWGGLVDVPAALDDNAARLLAAVLAGCGEDQVAVRGPGLAARRLTVAEGSDQATSWRPDGSVLITGGTGGIGARVARWAVGRGCTDMVLTSRSGPGAGGVSGVAAGLAQAGASVRVVACDVAQRSQARAVLERFAVGGGRLGALFHAAGVGQATALADTSTAELAAVAEAKVAGAANLDALTRELDLELDLFVTFSSVSSTWGSGLQPAYGAANAYLDALVEQRRSQGLPGTSVAWGLWGGDEGMGGRGTKAWLERSGLRAMDPDLAVSALAQAVDGDEGVVTVADVDWERFAPAFTLRRPSPLIADLPQVLQAQEAQATDDTGTDAAAALAERLAGLPADEQDEVLTDLIAAEAAAVLGYSSSETVEAGRAFRDLGFDSLTALELRNRLGAVTGIPLPSTLVFDYPTTAELATYLREEIGEGSGAAQAPLLTELDRLESSITGLPEDSELLTSVTARLQELLSRLTGAPDASGAGAVAGRLESATADEVMDFINAQFKGE